MIPYWRDTSEIEEGVLDRYTVEQFIIGHGKRTLAPRETMCYPVVRTAHLPDASPYFAEPETELAARCSLIACVTENLILEIPEPILDRMFSM